MNKKIKRFIRLTIDLLAPFAYVALVFVALFTGNALAIALAVLAIVWRIEFN